MTANNQCREALKPCPFCGGGDISQRTREWDSHYRHYLECMNCQGEISRGRQNQQDAIHEAIAAWNTRTSESPQSEDLVERVAVDVRDHTDMHCGLTLGGVTMFCDDARLSCENDGHGSPLRQTRCQCKDIAKAALTAINYDREQVRREALEDAAACTSHYQKSRDKRISGTARAIDQSIRALIEEQGDEHY